MRRSPRCFASLSVSAKRVGSSKAARERPSRTATSASACSTRYSNGWGFPKPGYTRSVIHRVTQLRKAERRRICRSSGLATARSEPATATATRMRKWSTGDPQRETWDWIACLVPSSPNAKP